MYPIGPFRVENWVYNVKSFSFPNFLMIRPPFKGHAHLTDFNVAATCEAGKQLKTLAGTMPYMAPEMFKAAAPGSSSSPMTGYSFSVDWWSLGITAYELKFGVRPFEIGMKTSVTAALLIIEDSASLPACPPEWSPEFTKFIHNLLNVVPEKRISNWATLKKTKLMANLKHNRLMGRQVPPPFVPNAEVLNCDPTFELEEMIVEAKPLHKKKKRLQRQQSFLSNTLSSQNNSLHGSEVCTMCLEDDD